MTRCEFHDCENKNTCKRYMAGGVVCNFKYYHDNPERFDCYWKDTSKLPVKVDEDVKENGKDEII